MLPETLIALACLIASKESVDTSAAERQLSDGETAQLESILQQSDLSARCLPESMEKLIQDTHNRITPETLAAPEPTRGCE
jgi:hypothetical protein